MRIHLAIIFIVLPSLLFARESNLPECSFVGEYRVEQSPDYDVILVTQGDLNSNGVKEISSTEPILVAHVKVLEVMPVLSVPSNIKLKSSWALSSSYRFSAGQQLSVPKIRINGEGDVYKILSLRGGGVLYIDRDGRFCNKALASSAAVFQAGELSAEPENVRLDYSVVELDRSEGDLRIIYNGSERGQISVQVVWVNGATIVSSTERVFDQFGGEIEVWPYRINVAGASASSVKVSFEIPERMRINPEMLSQIPLRARN